MRTLGNRVLGFLKVGVKKLFIRDEYGTIKEISPLCVLDFYVHESIQRNGIGKSLFEKMLASENIQPEKLAYDKSSDKLLKFLSKHYGLSKYVP
jgi:alpha-tubulin N-acetyltransferase 1